MQNSERVALEPVTSSSIHAVGYDGPRRLLAVQFKSGDVFQYADIAPELVVAFMEAESLGRFYAAHIKGQFAAAKLTGLCDKCGDGGYLGDVCRECGCATYAEAPRPVRHFVAYDVPKRRGPVQTVAGELVRRGELAERVEAVTCDKCLAALKSFDEMSL